MLEVGPEGGPYNALRAGDGGSSRQSLIAISVPEVAHTLTSGVSSPGVSAPGRRQEDDHNLVAVDLRNLTRSSGAGVGAYSETGKSYPVNASQLHTPGVADTVVRRLTELECERLQGYPDGWTDGQSGSARYRQLGNSVAVPVVEWIARRLVAIDGELA
jgi:DNA (cytosine-5)-methyltransferase 1